LFINRVSFSLAVFSLSENYKLQLFRLSVLATFINFKFNKGGIFMSNKATIDSEISTDTTESMTTGEQKFFINEDNFQRLRQLQQDIFEATGVSPSVRKLVNLLITEENLCQIKMKLISQFS
jgi:hypothetical protein